MDHDEQLQLFAALHARLDVAIAGINRSIVGINASLARLTALLQRQRDDEQHNGA